MGYNKIVVALLLLATATPLAYGLIPSGRVPDIIQPVIGLIPNLFGLINAANIRGRICCTPTGKCANGSVGFPGVEVNLNYTTPTGSVMTLARGITGPDGTFSLLVPNIHRLLGIQLGGVSEILKCKVVSSLPLNTPYGGGYNIANGVLSSDLGIVSVGIDLLFGLIGNYVAQ